MIPSAPCGAAAIWPARTWAYTPAHAACAGVYAHVRAGQIASAPHGPDGIIASDVIHAIPAALSA